MSFKPSDESRTARETGQADLTPLQAIRRFCVQCAGGPQFVEECGGAKLQAGGDGSGVCWFFPFRLGYGRPSVKTIRTSCLECMAGGRKFVAECWTPSCPVHAFRMGTNPNRAGQGDAKRFKSGCDWEVFVSGSTKAA